MQKPVFQKIYLDLEGFMRTGIHPDYQETTIRCACGFELKTRATKKDIRVEICSNCHPLFTGKQKLIDTEGRVERFMKKYGGSGSGKKSTKA